MMKFSTSNSSRFKVCVFGGAGGIGQPLALLLRLCPLVKNVAVYDIVQAVGVAQELSHINSTAVIKGYKGPEKLAEALKGSHIVACVGGIPRRPDMKSRNDLFLVNAKLMQDLTTSICENCPNACLIITSNPTNSFVPLAAAVMKKAGKYDPRRIFGLTGLDAIRARKFLGEFMKVDPRTVEVPIIGGHSKETTVPIISQTKPKYTGCIDDTIRLVELIRNAGPAILAAKDNRGTATLSTGYATFLLTVSILKGLKGERNVKDYSYVASKLTECSFFASDIILGKNGVEKICGLPQMSDYEKCLLKEAIPWLKKDIKTGTDFLK